jgi:hypothetical protein
MSYLSSQKGQRTLNQEVCADIFILVILFFFISFHFYLRQQALALTLSRKRFFPDGVLNNANCSSS